VTREAGDPRPAPADDATAPDAKANGSAGAKGDDAERTGDEDELAEQLDLPLDALLNWGTDPRDADKELAAQTEEALVAAERDGHRDRSRSSD